MAVAKALGARRVIAIDIQDERLDFAKSYAATDIWKSTKPQESESKMDYARRQSTEMSEALGLDLEAGENAVDLVVDCTGAEVCIATGIYLAKDGGDYVQVSYGPKTCAQKEADAHPWYYTHFTGRNGSRACHIPVSRSAF